LSLSATKLSSPSRGRDFGSPPRVCKPNCKPTARHDPVQTVTSRNYRNANGKQEHTLSHEAAHGGTRLLELENRCTGNRPRGASMRGQHGRLVGVHPFHPDVHPFLPLLRSGVFGLRLGVGSSLVPNEGNLRAPHQARRMKIPRSHGVVRREMNTRLCSHYSMTSSQRKTAKCCLLEHDRSAASPARGFLVPTVWPSGASIPTSQAGSKRHTGRMS
jgi:hypothetical protein